MKPANAIEALGALAHPHRLAAYRLLVRRGSLGLAAGVIAERLALPPSTLTFHLQALCRSGLLLQQREGRQLIYRADLQAMGALVGFLTENCCVEEGGACAPACATVPVPAVVRRRRAA